MAYKVRATRNGPGQYELSYGKGKKKLIATATNQDGKWCVGPLQCITLRDLKDAWGQGATERYEGVSPKQSLPPTPVHSVAYLAETQVWIDDAYDGPEAWHRWHIAKGMEEVVRSSHEIDGETYIPHTFKRPPFPPPFEPHGYVREAS